MTHSTVFHVEQTIEEVLRELDKGQAASLVRYFDEDKFQSFCKAGFEAVATNGTCALPAAAKATFEGLRNLSEPLPELRTVTWHYSEVTHTQLVTRVWPLVDVDQNGVLDVDEFVLLTKLVWLEALKQMQSTKRARGEHKELGKEIVMEYYDLLCSTVGGLQRVTELRKLFERPQFHMACSQAYQELAEGKPAQEVFLDPRRALAAFDKIAAQFPAEQPTPRKPDFALLPPSAISSAATTTAKNFLASPPASAVKPPPTSPVKFHLSSPAKPSPAPSPRKQTKGETGQSVLPSPRKISDCRPLSPQAPPVDPVKSPAAGVLADTPRAREMAGEDRVKSLQRVLQRLDVDHSGGFDKVEFTNVMKVIWLFSVHEDTLRLERDIASKKEYAVSQLIERGLSQLQQVCGGDPTKATELRNHFASAAFYDVCASVFREVDKDHSETVDKQECMAAFRIVMERLPGVSQIVEENGRSLVTVATELGTTLLENQWATLDLSSDGELQLNEFANAMKLTWIECSLIINGAAREKETTTKRMATGQLVEEAFTRLSTSGVTGNAQANKLRAAFETEAFELDCRNAFSKADVDDSENITKEECVEAVRSGLQAIPDLTKALGSFQKTLQEFAADVSSYIDGVWAILDWNHSGALDFDEFYAVVKLVRIQAQQVIAKAEGAENLVELYLSKLNKPQLTADLRAFFDTNEFRAFVSDSLQMFNIGGSNGTCDQKQAAELCKSVMIRQKGLEGALAALGNSINVYSRLIVSSVLRRFWPVLDVLGTGTLTTQELLPLIKIIYIVGAGLAAVNQPSTSAEGLVEQQLVAFGQFYEQETWLRMLFAGKNFGGICNEVFQSVDKDQSGSVDQTELIRAFGLVLQWVVSKFPTRFDQNSQALAQHAQQAISFAFATLDSDQSGSLSRSEFGNAVKLCFIQALSLTQPAQQRNRLQPVFFWQQGEHERRVKQERALKIVDNLLVELAKVNEVQADFVCQLLQSPQFTTECQNTFVSVDSDRSQSIDQLELLQAFRVLVTTFPGLQERVVNGCGLDTTLADRIEKLGASLVLLIFELVNSNPMSSASGRLDFQDFVVAMKVMLLKLLLPDESPGAVPL